MKWPPLNRQLCWFIVSVHHNTRPGGIYILDRQVEGFAEFDSLPQEAGAPDWVSLESWRTL